MADDIITINSVGVGQSIDNASVVRSTGVTVDRQRISLKGDLYADQPPLLEIYLLQLIELSRQQLVELKIQSTLLVEGFSRQPIGLDDLVKLRDDLAFNDPQPR